MEEAAKAYLPNGTKGRRFKHASERASKALSAQGMRLLERVPTSPIGEKRWLAVLLTSLLAASGPREKQRITTNPKPIGACA